MRLQSLMLAAASMGLTASAWARDHHGGGGGGAGKCWYVGTQEYCIEKVPEIGSTGSLAAIVVVAAVALIVWERRRRRAS